MINNQSNQVHNSTDMLITSSHKSQDTLQLIDPSVREIYNQLNNSINSVNKQIQHVIDKNQSQFLLAYRKHLTKINKELADIKNKSEQQEKMFSSNDRIKYLERQVEVFREEALRIYDKLQKVTQEMELYKSKCEELSKEIREKQREGKNCLQSAKISDSEKLGLSQKILHLQNLLDEKQQKILKLEKHNKKLKQDMNVSRIGLSNRVSLKSETSRNRYDQDYQSQRNSHYLKGSRGQYSKNDFEDSFMECVNTMKKQIAFRKYSSKLDLSNVYGLKEFRKIDKIRLLQLFLSNPQLQSWMFEKLFPNQTLQKIDIAKDHSIQEQQLNAQLLHTKTAMFKEPTKYTHRKIGFKLPKMDPNITKSSIAARQTYYN